MSLLERVTLLEREVSELRSTVRSQQERIVRLEKLVVGEEAEVEQMSEAEEDEKREL
jgi:hypothetical protein